MSKVIEEYNTNNNFGKHLGMTFEILEPGHISYSLQATSNLEAIPGMTHGGALAGLMDGILGVAALSAVEHENKLVATIEFKINYLKPVYTNEKLVGIGKVIQKGKSTLVVEGEIFSNKVLKVIATGTFKAYSKVK